MELDKLIIQTEVTKKMLHELDAAAPPPREGAYITGLVRTTLCRQEWHAMCVW
jgi:hypothetical protein